MSLIGTEVKPFKAQAYHNGAFTEVTEQNFKGKWSIVCFYPADFTFVCPTELEDLQDNYETLKSLGAEAYSVSTDTHFTHKAWHDSSEAIKKITYVMIGDPSHTISRNLPRSDRVPDGCCVTPPLPFGNLPGPIRR
jgi:alkyl hydroperoxide reductase subunit AhpC